ncbi:hypothetical protein T281_09725 [Rhodomicrobium udaipurense JA643]|uniref:Abasic site processing protein n=1 Tax=Rhodomicrobium udaipurense TaxID=1202716 RepID=A0A8I1GEJ2_9HYPH|nr:SOS response-associated peptidase [Rhodomicrobium udaipurense]KAI94667.1 hypothetical protein T281_09725 [Rhodomicrobium udaipurense JA643]MBJ7543329.1 SOS response-associated peptidase [Rhodomicrobium udaipurense]
MCGRFTQLYSCPEILAFYRIVGDICPDLAASWNVAPTNQAVVIAGGCGGLALTRMAFGLIPSWAKDPAIGSKLINARAETLSEKAAFRHALQTRRCVIPVSGFYEWGRIETGTRKSRSAPEAPERATVASGQAPQRCGRQPYYIASVGGAHLSLAGLWEQWNDRLTFAIITVPANPLLATIHERMPAILSAEDARAWIETGDAALLKPYPRDDLSMWPVSRRVNAPDNNDSSLVEAAFAEPPPEPRDSARNNGEKPESPQFSFPF